MSDIANNTLVDIDYIVSPLYDVLENMLPNPDAMEICREYVMHVLDDFVPSRLEWANVIGDSRTLYLHRVTQGLSAKLNSLYTHPILHETELKVRALLERVCPYPTWSYIFLQRLGGTLRVEITGDHRIDQWRVLTNNGTVSFDQVVTSFTKALEDRTFGTAEGLIPFELDDLVRRILTDQFRH